MKRLLPALLLLTASAARAEPSLDFLETFALPEKRAQALQQLVPGSEDYYFYHALHAQISGDQAAYAKTLADYRKRFDRTQGVRVLENRQALLGFEKNPQATLDYLRNELSLHFNHEREALDEASTAPTQLDPSVIDGERLLKARLAGNHNGLNDLSDAGLMQVAKRDLTKNQRRDLLNRLDRADFPGLLDLVVADLQEKDSGGFGSVKIHAKLFAAQLDALAERIPAVRQSEAWVNARLVRLLPDDDVDFEHDRAARRAWLQRARAFADGLDPKFNSLKASLLYQQLVLDRNEGVYDQATFLAFAQLPRQSGLVRRELREKAPGHTLVNPGDNRFQAARIAPQPFHDSVIQDYLLHFLAKADSWDAFLPYFEEWYLKETYAAAHLLAGTGDTEKLASLIEPAKLKALRERVDIDLLPTNPERIKPADPVSLNLALKNVPELLVKVYEVNTLAVCRETLENPQIGLDLDGLVATREFKLASAEPPLRRVEKAIDFPEMKGAGVWIVELIGNGRSSRALVRKGRLVALPEMTPSGQEFRILDDEQKPVLGARIHLGGQTYTADAAGAILLPFSTSPENVKAVVEHGGFAEVFSFRHEGESLNFQAGFHVDREQLLPGAMATVLVRPSLLANGRPVGLGSLEDLKLVIASTNLKGVPNREEVKVAALTEKAEFTHAFRVPDHAVSLEFTLSGRLQPLNRTEKQDVSDQASYTLNGLQAQAQTEALNLTQVGGQYQLDLRGLNGETRAGRPLQVKLRHRWINDSIDLTLSTDAKGRANLGALTEITSITATSPGGVTGSWTPSEDRVQLPNRLQAPADQPLSLAIPDHSTVLLSALRSGAPVADESAQLKAVDNVVTLVGLAPGDYELFVRPQRHPVAVRITRGTPVAGHLVSPHAVHQITDQVPLALGEPQVKDGAITLRVANATPFTRVHVMASRFLPAHDAFDALAWNPFPAPTSYRLGALGNQYASGRAIGDEIRYVLDRQSAEKFSGVLLPRPGLLLNPWERRSTSAEKEQLALGEQLARQQAEMAAVDAAAKPAKRMWGKPQAGAPGAGDFLDFLADGSVLLPNLKPENGVVRIPAADLRGLPVVTVVAVDLRGGMARTFSADDSPVALRDLRLEKALPSAPALTEMKLVSPLAAGGVLKLDASQDADMQVFDHLPQVVEYFQSLRNDDTLADFQVVGNWASLKPDDKLAFYGPHACHELHVFLYHKDRAFFDTVVKPYLANKRDKTFLDLWLLDQDLAAYTTPWSFARLNAAEQVLLARRLRDRATMTGRLLRDQLDLIPVDRTSMERFFDAGITLEGLSAASGGEGGGGKYFGLVARMDDRVVPTDNVAIADAVAMDKRSETRFSRRGVMAANGAMMPPATPAPAPMALAAAIPEPVAARKALGMERLEKKLEEVSEKAAYDMPALREREIVAVEKAKQLYRKPEATKEWAENNYWKLTPDQQLAGLIKPNRFWQDYAAAAPDQPFLSSHLAEASGSFAESMLALAVLDLPFEGKKHDLKREGNQVTFTAASPCIVFHKEIRPAGTDANLQPVVLAQKFFDHQDRSRTVEGQQVDKYIAEGFVKGRIYGGRVIITNPTGLPRKLDVLVQIPRGAIPVQSGFLTREFPVDVAAFGTQQIEYLFYFPQAGKYESFPAMASENDALAAKAEGLTFTVLEKPAGQDETSWDFVSQRGAPEAVLKFLRERNVVEIDLGRIAWRMKDKEFFAKTLDTLRDRQVYHDTLWSYGVRHNDSSALREWIAHNAFANGCGDWFVSALLKFDPIERLTYEHLEYAPLVNPRAHPVGGKRTILNEVLRLQYTRLVKVLGHKPALTSEDRLALTYYLLLQDRIADGLAQLAQVKDDEVSEKLQLAYLRAWAALAQGDAAAARKHVAPHAKTPVARWQKLFQDALTQLDEIEGKAVQAAADREGNEAAAASEPVLELKTEGTTLLVRHRLLEKFELNFYPMDIEVLFSKKPFLQEVGGTFSFIRPVRSEVVVIAKDGPAELKIALPDAFKGRNVTVEAVAGGLRKTATVFAGDVQVEVIANYGQVRVTDAAGKPLAKAYVKVYGRKEGGEAVFYKDGYTDLRGRFDYASLNSDDLDNIERFALLVLDDAHGAAIREAEPPKR